MREAASDCKGYMTMIWTSRLTLLAGLCLTGLVAVAAERCTVSADHCQQCGCACTPQKVCRSICEVKKVPETVYSTTCEEICVAGPSEAFCSPACDDGASRRWWWPWGQRSQVQYVPQCAELRTRTKLVKKTVDKDKVVYRWSIEALCPTCAAAAQAESSSATASRETSEFEPVRDNPPTASAQDKQRL